MTASLWLLPALAVVAIMLVAAVVLTIGSFRQAAADERRWWNIDETGAGRPATVAAGALVALMVASLLLALAGARHAPPEVCAARLGITWTLEAGATERLEDFARCTGRP